VHDTPSESIPSREFFGFPGENCGVHGSNA
jgi:hypothetical protein